MIVANRWIRKTYSVLVVPKHILKSAVMFIAFMTVAIKCNAGMCWLCKSALSTEYQIKRRDSIIEKCDIRGKAANGPIHIIGYIMPIVSLHQLSSFFYDEAYKALAREGRIYAMKNGQKACRQSCSCLEGSSSEERRRNSSPHHQKRTEAITPH